MKPIQSDNNHDAQRSERIAPNQRIQDFEPSTLQLQKPARRGCLLGF